MNKDRLINFGVVTVLATEATFGGNSRPANAKDIKFQAPQSDDKPTTIIYDANEWLNSGKLVTPTALPYEAPKSPEKQETLNPFPTLAYDLGKASDYGIKSEDDLKSFYNPESALAKEITSKDEYKKLTSVLSAVGNLVQTANTPDVTYTPYIFAGMINDELYISGAAAGDNFHQLAFYGVDESTISGVNRKLGIVLQVKISDFNRYTPGMALIKDKETGTVTYTPFVKDNQNPNESGMINNPLEGNTDGGQVTPQPTPDPGLFAADNLVFAKYVDGKYESKGGLSAKELKGFIPSGKWIEKSSADQWFSEMNKKINRLNPSLHYTLEAWIPGANPIIFMADKTDKLKGGNLYFEEFEFDNEYSVDDPDGGRVGAVEALSKQIRQRMEVVSDENGMVNVWVNTGKKNEYGKIIEKRQVSKDAPVDSYPKSWFDSKAILKDLGNSIFFLSALDISFISLNPDYHGTDVWPMMRAYVSRAEEKRIRAWEWLTPVLPNDSKRQNIPVNNASDLSGSFASIIKMKTHVE
ncbi:hypothetical protein HYS03_02045 [Candidatus Woesebacteria bacterium]|nr:hypothetical protein [Candidatus Woesebacteria bacterium]